MFSLCLCKFYLGYSFLPQSKNIHFKQHFEAKCFHISIKTVMNWQFIQSVTLPQPYITWDRLQLTSFTSVEGQEKRQSSKLTNTATM